MPQNVQSRNDELKALQAAQGLVVDAEDPVILRRAIDLAFDYRGDVTVHVAQQPTPIIGYLFDRVGDDASLEQSTLRIIPADGSARRTVRYSDVTKLEFTGRDTAAGKSFETWMRKYVEKKLAGEEASIHGTSHE